MLFENERQIIDNGQTPELKQVRQDILEMLSAAIKAVDPYNSVFSRFDENKICLDNEEIDISNFEKKYLAGFGKASVGMAQAVCDSTDINSGIIVTNDPDNKVKNKNVETFVGGHPIPNDNSLNAANRIIELVKNCNEADLLIVLISGGGSALLSKPRIKLEDLQKTTDLLLKSGANINEINTIRKHLSHVKGGQLAKSAKCKVVSLIISDIIGDPMDFIASGPTYPNYTTYKDAEKIIQKYNLWEKLPNSAKEIIQNGMAGKIDDTPKKDDVVFNNVHNCIIANNNLACKAVEDKAEELGYKSMILTTALDGEAKDVGKYLVEKAKDYHTYSKKSVFIAGGETTVKIKGNGKGGRNQEMVLSTVKEIAGSEVVFASFATDGVDGMSPAAGAVADSFTLERANKKDIEPMSFLKENDSYHFFKKIDDLLMTGPTGTNVMDVQIIIKIA